jgi:hypothetical protein
VRSPRSRIWRTRDVVGLPAGVDHLEVQHLHVAAARKQTYGREAAFAASDTNCVTFSAETDLLAPQLDPVAVATATAPIVVAPLGSRIGRDRASQHQRTGQRRRHLSQMHRHLPEYGATAPTPNDARAFCPHRGMKMADICRFC